MAQALESHVKLLLEPTITEDSDLCDRTLACMEHLIEIYADKLTSRLTIIRYGGSFLRETSLSRWMNGVLLKRLARYVAPVRKMQKAFDSNWWQRP